MLKKQGMYLPEFEHDNCGAGFICSLKGIKSNDIIHKALQILEKLEHRGAVSADGKTGDGAGILIDIPHDFFIKNFDFKFPKKESMPLVMCSFRRETIKEAFVLMFLKNILLNKVLKLSDGETCQSTNLF